MSDQIDTGRRGLLTGVAMAGAAAGAAGILAGATSIREAHAQMLDTGISENSVLAKIRKAGVLKAGYAQTGPWFYKDAKTGELGGIYKDCVEKLKAEGVTVVALEVTPEAIPMPQFIWPKPCAIVFGNEVNGVGDSVLKRVDAVVKIPMHGHKNTINVATAFGVVLYAILAQWEAL